METEQGTKAKTLIGDRKGSPAEPCLTEDRPDPCTLVIAGASGDLTARKVVPALFNLYTRNSLPEPFLVVGCARTKMSDEEFTAAGGNKSLIHVDFMFGSEEMDVDGILADGSYEPVMRSGEWAFDF